MRPDQSLSDTVADPDLNAVRDGFHTALSVLSPSWLVIRYHVIEPSACLIIPRIFVPSFSSSDLVTYGCRRHVFPLPYQYSQRWWNGCRPSGASVLCLSSVDQAATETSLQEGMPPAMVGMPEYYTTWDAQAKLAQAPPAKGRRSIS